MWDLNSLVAIDIHTHAHTPPEAADPEELAQRAAMKAYFGNKGEELTTPAIAAYYRERKIGCVIFTVDSEKESGHRRYPNEEVAKVAAREQRHHDRVRQHRSGQGQGRRQRGAPAGA